VSGGTLPAHSVSRPPLTGWRVLVTRAEDQAACFVNSLRELGAEPVLCPTIRIDAPEDPAPLDMALDRLASFDRVVFTSVNGVRAVMDRFSARREDPGRLSNSRLVAIGSATARALEAYGLRPEESPDEATGEALVAGIGDVGGLRIFLPVADIARPTVAEGLRRKNAEVCQVTAYRTLPVSAWQIRERVATSGPINIATFTSPSTVRNLLRALDESQVSTLRSSVVAACIGPTTAEAARALGLSVDIVASEQTMENLLAAIVAYTREKEHGYA
jgi:uroporphyrinogen III methyltransferase / synthase